MEGLHETAAFEGSVVRDWEQYREQHGHLSDEQWENVVYHLDLMWDVIDEARETLEPWEWDQFEAHLRDEREKWKELRRGQD